jgi:hypothetical protein
MSLKRGLLRVWAVSAVAWFVYAFAIIDAGDAIYYAWQYHFEKETLIEAELKEARGGREASRGRDEEARRAATIQFGQGVLEQDVVRAIRTGFQIHLGGTNS